MATTFRLLGRHQTAPPAVGVFRAPIPIPDGIVLNTKRRHPVTTEFNKNPWLWFAAVLNRLRRQRQQRTELRLLDPMALRDLGIDRSELGSIAAEASGAASCTRQRVCVASPDPMRSQTWGSCSSR
jgi:uncharacterized protein YjiS (DUF1127 family)